MSCNNDYSRCVVRCAVGENGECPRAGSSPRDPLCARALNTHTPKTISQHTATNGHDTPQLASAARAAWASLSPFLDSTCGENEGVVA